MNPSSRPAPLEGAAPAAAEGRRVLRALAIDLEPATAELISLWLAGEAWSFTLDARPGDAVSLILVEMAYPRYTERQRLRALAEVWPGVPVIVLSPTFFAGVSSHGDVARQLGVTAVLATPLDRGSLVAAVRGVIQPTL